MSFHAGDDIFVSLLLTARNGYREQVKGGKMNWYRFRNEFAAFLEEDDTKKFTGNCSRRIVQRFRELFVLHEKALRVWFEDDDMTEEKTKAFIDGFNKGEFPDNRSCPVQSRGESRPEKNKRAKSVPRKVSGLKIKLLTYLINKLDVFTETLTEEHLEKYYAGEKLEPVRSRNNRHMVWFFHCLHMAKVIVSRWQKGLLDSGLVLTSRGREMKRANLTTTLTNVRIDVTRQKPKTVENMVNPFNQIIAPAVEEYHQKIGGNIDNDDNVDNSIDGNVVTHVGKNIGKKFVGKNIGKNRKNAKNDGNSGKKPNTENKI